MCMIKSMRDEDNDVVATRVVKTTEPVVGAPVIVPAAPTTTVVESIAPDNEALIVAPGRAPSIIQAPPSEYDYSDSSDSDYRRERERERRRRARERSRSRSKTVQVETETTTYSGGRTRSRSRHSVVGDDERRGSRYGGSSFGDGGYRYVDPGVGGGGSDWGDGPRRSRGEMIGYDNYHGSNRRRSSVSYVNPARGSARSIRSGVGGGGRVSREKVVVVDRYD